MVGGWLVDGRWMVGGWSLDGWWMLSGWLVDGVNVESAMGVMIIRRMTSSQPPIYAARALNSK